MAYSVVDVYGSSGSGKDNLFDEIEDDIEMNDLKLINLAEPVDLGDACTEE
jgi:ribose 1,5-bisphosphokinase PhnN